MRQATINDKDREQWIANDEGLYNLQRRSGQSMRLFIRENRAMIDEVIRNVRDGVRQAHYLAYGH